METELKDEIKTAKAVERQRIANLIETASYKYDSVTVNNFVTYILGQITDLDDE